MRTTVGISSTPVFANPRAVRKILGVRGNSKISPDGKSLLSILETPHFRLLMDDRVLSPVLLPFNIFGFAVRGRYPHFFNGDMHLS